MGEGRSPPIKGVRGASPGNFENFNSIWCTLVKSRGSFMLWCRSLKRVVQRFALNLFKIFSLAFTFPYFLRVVFVVWRSLNSLPGLFTVPLRRMTDLLSRQCFVLLQFVNLCCFLNSIFSELTRRIVLYFNTVKSIRNIKIRNNLTLLNKIQNLTTINLIYLKPVFHECRVYSNIKNENTCVRFSMFT